MRQRRARELRLVVALFLLAGVGCGDAGLPPAIPQTELVIRVFADDAKAALDPPRAPGVPRPVHLYVDASGSMKGFIGRSNSDYSRALRYLLEHAATAGYDLSVFGFSDRVSVPLGNVGDSAILRSGFYSGRETSFPNLFERVTKELALGTVSVIVSDLVQSGKTGDQRALVLAFQQLARKHPEILLLAFRSSFEGTYFVEGARSGTSYRLSLDGTTAEKSRPFYILVVAPTWNDMEEARRFLLADLKGAEEFDASSPGLTLAGVEYRPGEDSMPVWNAYKAVETLSSGVQTPRAVLSFLEISPPAELKSPLRLRFAIQRSAGSHSEALRSPRNLMFRVHRSFLQNGKWRPAEEAGLSPEALFTADGKFLTVNYSVPRPSPYSWDLYRIRLMPGAGNLRLPFWTEEWTTYDDSLLAWGNRTLKLELFLEAMTRSLREQVPLSEHYLLLGRGER